MASATQQAISQFEANLQNIADQGELSPEGHEMLEIIRSGGVLPAWLNATLQGATLSGADEIIGSLRGRVPGSGASRISEALGTLPYAPTPGQVGRALEHRGVEEFRERRPGAAIPLEMAGGLLPAWASRGKSLPLTARAVMKEGAKGLGLGATSGFMHGEGGLLNRSQDAIIGGAIGGPLGFLSPVIGRAIGPVWNRITGPASRKRIAQEEARHLVQRALKHDDALTPEGALAYIAQEKGIPLAVADLGPNSRGLLDVVKQLPGPGKRAAVNYLNQRMKGRPGRLDTILSRVFGTKSRFYDDYAALRDARAASAGRLYDQAFENATSVSDAMRTLFKRPSLQKAVGRARELAQESGEDIPFYSVNKAGDLVDELGDVVQRVDTKFLHWVKVSLDNDVYPATIPEAGLGKAQLNQLRTTLHEFLKAFDDVNPRYATARAAWAGDSAALSSMNVGRDIFRARDVDELGALVKNFSPSEMESFRLGTLQALREMVEGTVDTANSARTLIRNPKRRMLIRMAFGSDEAGEGAFKEFMGNLEQEIEMAITERTVMGNAATMGRQEAIKQVRAVSEVEAPTNIQEAIFKWLRSGSQELAADTEAQIADEMGKLLMTRLDSTQMQSVMALINQGRTLPETLQIVVPEVARLLPGITIQQAGREGPRLLTGEGGEQRTQDILNAAQQFVVGP